MDTEAVMLGIAQAEIAGRLIKGGVLPSEIDYDIVGRAAKELLAQYERGEAPDYAAAVRVASAQRRAGRMTNAAR